jgi:hypothetical protein
MADEFLRIGGRGDDETAKAIRTDNEGNLSVQITGRAVKEHIFHEDRTTTGQGTAFTVGSYRGLVVEISGTATAFKVEFKARMFTNDVKGLVGQNLSTSEYSKETTNNSKYFYLFDVTGIKDVIMTVASVSGGDLTIKGVATLDAPQFKEDLLLPNLTALDTRLGNHFKGGTNLKETRLGGPLDAGANSILVNVNTPIRLEYLQFYFNHDNDIYPFIETYDKAGAPVEFRRAQVAYTGSDAKLSAKAIKNSPVSFLELSMDEPGWERYALTTPKGHKGYYLPYGLRIRIFNDGVTSQNYSAMVRYAEVNS